MTTLNQVERFRRIIERSLFHTDGTLDYDRLQDALIELSCQVEYYCEDHDSEELWYLGDGMGLADLIAGAYWHFAEWHAGQNSKSYQVLSMLGNIYSPNYAQSPEEGTVEADVYQALNAMAE